MRKYAEALVLLEEANEVDEQAEDEGELAYKIRAVSYEQQILTIEAMMGLEEAESEIRRSVDEHTRRLEAEIREDLDRTRRESIQLLGLLAAVIALISVLAGGGQAGVLMPSWPPVLRSPAWSSSDSLSSPDSSLTASGAVGGR